MAKVIALANQKGGVAKTTSSISIGVGLVNKGYKVLIIDCDPQGSCTAALGYQEPDKLEITLSTIIGKILNEEEFDLEDGILHNEEGVDLLPSNIELAGVEMSLISIMGSETTLREYVQMIEDRYDYIILDCSPNLGQLTINALSSAEYVIIPVQAAYLPIKGLEQLIKTIGRVKKKMNPSIKILGIVLTMVQLRTNYAKEIIDALNLIYGSQINIFETMIPQAVKAAEAPAMGVSIYAHDKNGKVAKAYRELTEEVIRYAEER